MTLRRYPTSKGREAPAEGRRGKFAFRIKSYSHLRCSEGSNKPCAHQNPETLQRLRQNCVWVSPVEVRVHSGLPQGQGLWVQQTWVWHKLSRRRSALTTPQSYQNLHRTGKQTLEGHKQNLVCTRTQEKGPHKRLNQTWPWVSKSLQRRLGLVVASAGLGALSVAMHAWPFWRRLPLSLLPPTIVWPQVNNREGTQHYPSIENWIKVLLNMAWPITTRPISPSVSLSHQENSISLLSFSIRGQADWKPQSQKTNQSDHVDHSLV